MVRAGGALLELDIASMDLRTGDTIAALGSPPGSAARGIVRISGRDSRRVLEGLFRPDELVHWRKCRQAECHTGRLRIGGTRVPLTLLVCIWPHRRSYTGEPMAELHAPGSPPLLETVLAQLYASGVRPARPGEFTLRAFLAGRIDLVQAEAVLGVVDAHSHRELQTALQQLAGGLSGRLGEVRGDLLDLLADLEAGLDFVDEDIEFVGGEEVVARLSQAQQTLETLLDQASMRMRSSGRMRIVLAGLPNAGKSTLFNALIRREAALVSELAGTTRDYLSAELDWNGVSVELIDTAGWEAAARGIMSFAQGLRGEQVEAADLVVWCRAANLDAAAQAADRKLLERLRLEKKRLLVAATKSDLAGPDSAGAVDVELSAQSGRGLAEFARLVAECLTAHTVGERQFVGTTAARSQESLAAAIAALQRGVEAAAAGAGDEVVAIEVREALGQLGSILGTAYTEDILDRIFSKFCIGK